MSWSTSFNKPVKKEQAIDELDKLVITGDAPMQDQFNLAKAAVRFMLHGIPGPYVSVSLSGHANGVGWQKKEGWANDCVAINITQWCESDLPSEAKY